MLNEPFVIASRILLFTGCAGSPTWSLGPGESCSFGERYELTPYAYQTQQAMQLWLSKKPTANQIGQK
jgi:hypothetical protein